MQPVTDPSLLAQLNGGSAPGLRPVSDPAILAALGAASAPSGLESLIRGAANGATFNAMPMIAAAGDATIPLDAGSSTAKTWGQRYHENLSAQTARDQTAAADHPGYMIAGDISGALVNPISRAVPSMGALPGAIVRGVGEGAAYGTGSALSHQDNAADAAKEIGAAAMLGGALPIGGAAIKGMGKMVPAVLGGITTGAGSNAVRQAFDAGATGGGAATAFQDNLRDPSHWGDVVDQARGALAGMRAARNAAYRSGMVDISKDKTVLDLAPVNAALADVNKIGSFKGQTLGGAGDATWNALNDTVGNWAKLDPAEYHTPEGMDFLKQQVGQILADTKPNTAASTMAGKVYGAIKSTIKDQAPTYAKVMSDYSDASDAVNDIQRELSLGAKGNPATALRKLQSVMRDNANTSWGQRADYADTLADNGASTLMPSLAGQALSAGLPRGLARYGDVGLGLGVAALHNPMGLAALPFASPRAVGEGAYYLGKGASLASRVAPNARIALSPVNIGRVATAPGVSNVVPYLLPQKQE